MYEAMEILGYGTLYNSREALRRNLCTFVGTMLTDKYEARGPWPPRIEQFESLWGEYRAISGEVAYAFSEEIIPLYPDAKIILTVRDDEEKWFASSMNTSWYNNSHLFTRILYALDPNWVQIREYVGKMFKYFYRGDFPANGIRMYREHNAMVKRLGGDRVLVFNTKDGWGPLCEHLGKPVPSVPFPHVNKTAENRHLFRTMRLEGMRKLVKRWMARGSLTALVFALIWWRRKRIASILQGTRAMLIG